MSDTNNNRLKSLAKDTGLFAISNFGSKILLFLLTPLYTNILATEEYGIADLISTTINFVYPILTLAIADATLRFALDNDENKTNVFTNSLFFIILSVIVLCFLKPFSGRIDPSLTAHWNVFVITYALFNIHNCISNFVKGIDRNVTFAIQGIIHTITLIVSNIVSLVILKIGLDGYLYSIIISFLIPIMYMVIRERLWKYLSGYRFSWNHISEMMRYSIPMIPTFFAWAINASIDKYMIIHIIDLGASGIYSIAHKIPTIFTTIITVFTNAWQLSAIKNFRVDDESDYYTSIYNYLNTISVIGCLFIIMFSKAFATILFAKEYYIAWTYVPMLTISALFSALSGFLASAFRAYKKTGSLFWSVAIGSIINITVNFYLIPLYGPQGAAIATALSFFAVWFSRMLMVQKIVNISLDTLKTISLYVVLLVSAVGMSSDNEYKYIICLIMILLSFIIGRKEIKKIISFVFGIKKQID